MEETQPFGVLLEFSTIKSINTEMRWMRTVEPSASILIWAKFGT